MQKPGLFQPEEEQSTQRVQLSWRVAEEVEQNKGTRRVGGRKTLRQEANRNNRASEKRPQFTGQSLSYYRYRIATRVLLLTLSAYSLAATVSPLFLPRPEQMFAPRCRRQIADQR